LGGTNGHAELKRDLYSMFINASVITQSSSGRGA
jgi:hypothetical protein